MAEAGKTIEIQVLRYRPEQDAAPVTQSYQVPFTDDMSVLQGLQYIKDHLDGTLSFRWSCRMAICGSCGMMIDGKPKLSCKTFLRDFYPEGVRVEALAHFPIERDLVPAVDDFIVKLERIKPYIIPKEARSLEQGEYLQTPEQLEHIEQFSSCINCMLCYAACPEYGLTPKFIGPAAISMAHRWNSDSRDGGRDARQEEVATGEGVWECSFVGACSEVCPEHVDPASALQQVKIKSTVDWVLEKLVPGGRKEGG